MAANQWFKFYGGEYLSDPKIASLTPQERSCWVTLMCLASLSSEQGKVEYLTIEALLQKSGIVWDPYDPEEWDKAMRVFDKFERMRMISKGEDGVIEILNWRKRQEANLTNAERQARFREKHKETKESNGAGYESNARIEENRIDKNNTSVANAPQEVTEEREEEAPKKVSSKKYPNAKQVFALWGKYPKNWDLNTTQLRAAENLFEERGMEDVQEALKWYEDLKDREFCPQVSTPYELDSKWQKFEKFVDEQEL